MQLYSPTWHYETVCRLLGYVFAFLACPCGVELTTSSVSLSPPLEPGGVRYSLMPMHVTSHFMQARV